MVGAGFFMLGVFVLAIIATSRNTVLRQRWLLKLAVFTILMPWIARNGLVRGRGRPPAMDRAEILPTRISVSSLSVGDLIFSLSGFVLLYTALLVVEMYLMIKFARQGPDDPTPTGGTDTPSLTSAQQA